jgi:hypothetical protein
MLLIVQLIKVLKNIGRTIMILDSVNALLNIIVKLSLEFTLMVLL